MRLTERLEGLTRAAARRPRATIALIVLLALLGGGLATSLRPSTGVDTFVSRGSAPFQATADDQRHFGSDSIIVMVREPLTDLVETKDLATVTELEACLAGQTVVANPALGSFIPAAAGSGSAYGGASSPCGQLMRAQPAKVVYGPGTFLNRAVAAVNQQIAQLLSSERQTVALREQQAYTLALGEHLGVAAARRASAAAGQLATQAAQQQLETLALNSGITAMPRIDSKFIPAIVFDQTRGVNQPKARFAYLFPTADSALIQVRLKSGLSDAQQAEAIRLIRAAVSMPRFALAYGGTYTVTGAPVVVQDLAGDITGSIAWLLLAALAVMALALALLYRRSPRLLPLLTALCATGITFGLMKLLGAPLTMASVAVLPILIGLAVDYAIQFGYRMSERDADPGRGLSLATLATAALATCAGFLVLVVSPVPMVRSFGLLLVVGILVALPCALALGSAVAVISAEAVGPLRASVLGAGEILGDLVAAAGTALRGAVPAGLRGLQRGGSDSLPGPVARVIGAPGRVLAVGLVLAAAGWIADTQTSVQSDVTKLVPSGMPALRDLHTLERITGVSGEIDVLVRGADVTSPAVVSWMTGYETALLAHYGYLETRGCARSTLCPALSLPDLFSAGGGTGATHAGSASTFSASQIRGILAAVPSYFSQAVITPDHREATLAFGIRLMPLARQQAVIDYMRSQLHPPAGANATLAGLPVLAAQANVDLSAPARRILSSLLALLAVAAVLLGMLRSRRRTLIPLVPIVLATGWSALILFIIGIPLNPMSATLGTLVIAISTEFSVLIAERFRREREIDPDLAGALNRTLRSTGSAVLASGLTAIAGFAVLTISNITMLRDFGFVTLIDLSVSLGGVLLVLPAVLALEERGWIGAASPGARRRMPRLRPERRPGVAES